MNSAVYFWHTESLSMWHSALKENTLAHAHLVLGQKGMAKQELALHFAKRALCQETSEMIACGHCKSCKLFEASTHPDFLMIENDQTGSQIKIEQVRALSGFIAQTSSLGGKQVILIEDAERLNINSVNALLKNLEEPSAKTLFILTARSKGFLKKTLLSRLQVLELRPIRDHEAMTQWLQEAASNHTHVNEAISYAQGRPLRALEFLQNKDTEQTESFSGQFVSMMRGDLSLVELSISIPDPQVELILEKMAQWLWQLAVNQAQAQNDQPYENNIAKMMSYLEQKADRAEVFKLSETIQSQLVLWRSTANPNKHMLLESLFARWRQLLSGQNKRNITVATTT